MEKKLYKAYVINIDKNVDRWNNIKEILSSYNIEFERFPAINGTKLPQNEVDNINKNKEWSLNLMPGEIGCYKSHITLCEKFLENPESEFLWIIEDDFFITGGFSREFLTTIMASIPKDCDILRLIASNTEIGKKLVELNLDGKIYYIIDPFKIPLGTTSYIVSKNGAKKIVNNMKYKRPIDVDYAHNWNNKLNIYVISPNIPAQLSKDAKISDIGKRSHRPFFKARYYRLQQTICRYLYAIKKFGFLDATKYQLQYYLKK